MLRWLQYTSIGLLCLNVITLLGLHSHSIGWISWLFGVLTLIKTGNRKFSRDIFLLYVAVFILAISPISPDISWEHIFIMGLGMFSAILIPFLIGHYIYKNNSIAFNFQTKIAWSKLELSYFLFAILMAYLILPYYLKSTGSYLNWGFEPNLSSIARLFIGINLVGIWEELFFINVTLGILKKHLSFALANLIQALIFSAVLYEFGFISWGIALVFIFALFQGYILNKTQSLLYIIVVHLSLDFILFLALLNAHYPNWVPIFLPMGA